MASSKSAKPRRKPRFWAPFVWATIPTAIATGFGCLPNEWPEQLVDIFMISLVVPAALICEALGFGHFSIFGPNTIPDWLFITVIIAVLYLYCLILVLIVRPLTAASKTFFAKAR